MFLTCHWSGSRPLVSITLLTLGPHWDSSWLSCCCPVSWSSCSFRSAGHVPSHASTVYSEVDVGVGQLAALVLGLSGSWLHQSASVHSLTPTSRASSPTLSQVASTLQKAARSWVSSLALRPWVWLTCTHTARTCSTVLPRQGTGPARPSESKQILKMLFIENK